MTRLKLGPIGDEKPVKVTVELPAALWRSLTEYGVLLGRDSAGNAPIAPERLIVPMLDRFVSTDRGFARARRPAG